MRLLRDSVFRSCGLMLLGLVAAAPLPGCDDGGGADESEARPSARPKRDLGPVEEATPAPDEAADDYSYVSIGKRDPFRSFIEVGVAISTDAGPVGPLQLHEIDQYQLRGIVWNIAEPKALIEDPDGIGHVVELQALIGKNWGRVTQIKPTELIITEEYRDPIENELIINEVTMRLPDPSTFEGKR